MHVDSTAIRDIAYDRDRGKLFVTFDGGAEYVYVGVPGEVCRSFLKSRSKGGFFAEEIRDRYPYNKL
jgi:lysyl-tRNA synthetase class 2